MNTPTVLAIAGLLAASTAVPAHAQAPLPVYSDDFTSGTAAPGSAQRGTRIPVDVDVLEELEAETSALRVRMDAHLADSGAHQPHSHPHSHGGGPPSVYSSLDHHGPLRELLAEAIALLLPLAQAQTQPPPLVVYDQDMTGPSSTAPTTPRTDLDATLDVDIPLIDQVRALIASLDQRITAHVAARPGHAHDHPHSH